MANATRSSYAPVSTGGAFGAFGRLFVTTPAYRGDGQPAPATGGILGGLFGATPVYRTAPPTPSEPTPSEPAPDEPSDSDPAPGPAPGCEDGPLTIVITRD